MFPAAWPSYLWNVGEPRSIELQRWFEDDELDACPFCGQQAVPRTDSKVSICLACEAVWLKDGKAHRL
jgi:ribosomal protein L37AE/L43A